MLASTSSVPAALEQRRWLALFAAGRLGAAIVAAGLLTLHPGRKEEMALGAAGLTWALASVVSVRRRPALAAAPAAWLLDVAVTLGLVLLAGEWRSPFYLMAVTALVLPATTLPWRAALGAGVAFAVAYFALALTTGIEWGQLAASARLESFSTHLLIPILVVAALAYAARLLDELAEERARAEALALEAERRRIGWELHDSAKQRIHAARLVVSAVAGEEDGPLSLALRELDGAGRDMDASLHELRTTLGGHTLAEAIGRRAEELTAASGIPIAVHGSTGPLPAFAAAHAYRVASEAMTNAVRHARASQVEVALAVRDAWLELSVRDDGRGMPDQTRADATGLRSMQARAEALGGRLAVGAGPGDAGTEVALAVPLEPLALTPPAQRPR